MDKIKGDLPRTSTKEAGELVRSFSTYNTSSVLTIGWRRSASRLAVEPRREEERERRATERRPPRSARSASLLSPPRVSRTRGERRGGRAGVGTRGGRAGRGGGKRLFVVDDCRWRALSRAPPFPPARPARSELPSGSPVLIFCPVFHRVSLNCCPSRHSRTTIGRRIRPSTLIGLPLPPSLPAVRRRVQLCCER